MSKSKTNVTENKYAEDYRKLKAYYDLSKSDMQDLYKAIVKLELEIKRLKENNKMVLEWFNNFVDYVQEYDDHIYDLACKWADKVEKQNYGSK